MPAQRFTAIARLMPAMNGYGQFSGSHPTVDLVLRVVVIVVLALAIFGLLPALADSAG